MYITRIGAIKELTISTIEKINLILDVVGKHSDEEKCVHSFDSIIKEICNGNNDNKSKGLVPLLEPEDHTNHTTSFQKGDNIGYE